MSTTRYRSAAALTIAGLTAAVLPALASPANAADTQAISKSFTYQCDTTAGTLKLGTFPTGVKVDFTAPTTVAAGSTIAPVPVNITLTLDEKLRAATKTYLQGTDVEGSSKDAALQLTVGKASKSYVIAGLAAPKQKIPDAAPWNVAVSGTSPSITVPPVGTSAALAMPTAFTINALVYRTGQEPAPVLMNCAVSGDRALGSVAITGGEKAKPKLSVSVSPSKIVAKRTKAVVTVKASSSKVRPTGKIAIYNGRTKVGSGTLSRGAAKIRISAFKKKGKYTLTVKYGGDDANVSTSAKKAVRVR